ncbi:MAG: glycosyltransferase family 39 protein [Bryobacteraceae bacterium]
MAALLSGSAAWFFHRGGYTLSYGDALAHLNIARRLTDSRTPGFNQIGTVWLPLPHLVMAPFAARDDLWRSGLAGAIPCGLAFVLAAVFLGLSVKAITESRAAAVAAALLFAANPNVLYLQSIPMTEALFAACLATTLFFCCAFQRQPSLGYAAAAGVCATAGAMTRYEGWFLLPFAGIYFLIAGGKRRWLAASLFAAFALSGPLLWLFHNWWYFGDALEFYHGPYSPKAIQGAARYPGQSDWRQAWVQYSAAVRWFAGRPLLWVAGVGAVLHLTAFRTWARSWWPVVLLALPPVFYLWSLHSGATPIFVPDLWPNSYYNTRYAITAMPLVALAAALGIARLPLRAQRAAALLAVGAAMAPWLLHPSPEAWIAWKESQVNSETRRRWTSAAAEFLRANYRPGGGVFTTFGDVTGVFLEAGIPLRETLTWDNNPHWQAAVHRPDLFLWEEWAVALAGGPVQSCVLKAALNGPRYTLRKRILSKGAPAVEIYRRESAKGIREDPVYQGPRRDE